MHMKTGLSYKQVILDLKNIVKLVVAPVHTGQTIAYLEVKIIEHSQRCVKHFPHVTLLPKLHYWSTIYI